MITPICVSSSIYAVGTMREAVTKSVANASIDAVVEALVLPTDKLRGIKVSEGADRMILGGQGSSR